MQTNCQATAGDLKRLVSVASGWADEVTKARLYLEHAKAELAAALAEQNELKQERDGVLRTVRELERIRGCDEDVSRLMSTADALSDLIADTKYGDAVVRLGKAEGALAYARLIGEDYGSWLDEILDEYRQGLLTDDECLRRLADDASWDDYDDDDNWMAEPPLELQELWRLFRLWFDRSMHVLVLDRDGSGFVRIVVGEGDQAAEKRLVEWNCLEEAVDKLNELLRIKLN